MTTMSHMRPNLHHCKHDKDAVNYLVLGYANFPISFVADFHFKEHHLSNHMPGQNGNTQ